MIELGPNLPYAAVAIGPLLNSAGVTGAFPAKSNPDIATDYRKSW